MIDVIRSLTRRRGPRCSVSPLSAPGPVVAVCGLAGGSGTSTLAYVLARQLASESAAPVLLAEAESGCGDLGRIAGTWSAWSLGELASTHRDKRLPDDAWGETELGLRVLSVSPRTPRNVLVPEAAARLRALVDELRAAHGLVVLDCGTLRAFDARLMLSLATHVVWVVRADPRFADRGREVLAGPLAPSPSPATELVAAVAAGGRRPRPGLMRALRSIAEDRCDRTVLVPDEPSIATDSPARLSGSTAIALTAIASFIQEEEPSFVQDVTSAVTDRT